MDANLEIIGNESSVIYYNLNKQFSNIKKLIITKEIILESFEDERVKEFFSELSASQSQTYSNICKKSKEEGIFDGLLKNDLYKAIQENLSKISQSLVDIKLKDYNFMSSVSNAKFNVTLRCDNFSITKYYEEKGQILSAIRNLVKQYIEFKFNIFRLPRIKNFQIEIYESEEIHKHIILKKESNSLLLSSTLGFPKNSPIDYNNGSEFYISKNEKFNFYKNSQTSAIIREHNKLIEASIKEHEKILTNEELMLINNTTKNIADMTIEMYFNKKGGLRILNLSLSETMPDKRSENGFMIYKSSNNYDRVSIVTLRDNLEEDFPNPKYLLIRNENDIKELLERVDKVTKVDGIIFTANIYSPLFDKLGQNLNIDIIYYNKILQKSLDIKIDWENFKIEIPENEDFVNPFSNIIMEQNKEKDEFLERLKNIDLNTPIQQQSQYAGDEVNNIAMGLISSPNSSTHKNISNSSNKMGLQNNSQNGKKSAIGLLAEAVINNTENQVDSLQSEQQTLFSKQDMNKNNNNSSYSAEKFSNSKNSEFTMNNIQENTPESVFETKKGNNIEDYGKYENILATKLLTSPDIASGIYFADINNISQINGGEIYFLTTNKENMTNPNLKYILPINLNDKGIKNCYLLINSTNDYFFIDEIQEINYFVNLSHIENQIKENFLNEIIKKVKKVSIILLKENVDLLEKFINKIDSVFIKDIQSSEEYEHVKSKILTFEKRYLTKE